MIFILYVVLKHLFDDEETYPTICGRTENFIIFFGTMCWTVDTEWDMRVKISHCVANGNSWTKDTKEKNIK